MEKFDLSKRIKKLRNQVGFSQERLAEEAGLSLRTIQRIENGETVPRGDSLNRLAIALKTSPNEIIDWQIQEDQNFLTVMNLSSIGFIFFPLLGIILPLVLWVFKKEKIKHVDETGKSILNFQITWTIVIFLFYSFLMANIFFQIGFPIAFFGMYGVLGVLYLYNLGIIIFNTIRSYKRQKIHYGPAFNFLR